MALLPGRCSRLAQHMDRRLDQVPHHRQMWEQIEVLEHHPDLRAHCRDHPVGMGLEYAPVFIAISQPAVDPDTAGLRRLQVVDAAQQGRFAAARGADDADHLAGCDREVDAAQHVQFPKMLVQIFDLDHRSAGPHSHGRLRR